VNVVVFVGPTLPRALAQTELDAAYLPPAGQGDIYLAVRAKPDAIALIDGYFKHTPAVWHKEVLWALSQGVHVFGASSMGALRACELAPYGMIGVGEIYQQFQQGDLEDDDEVTIVHSDQDTGFAQLSEAMVNIRATLRAAAGEKVVNNQEAEHLIKRAKQLPYAQRTYERLLTHAPSGVRDRLAPWLTNNKVDLKRSDALAMLRKIKSMQDNGELNVPFEPEFEFAHTDAWEQVRREIRLKELRDVKVTVGVSGDAVLNELRLSDATFAQRCAQALVHTLSQELAQGLGEEIDQSLLERAVQQFRIRHALQAPTEVQAWLAQQDLDVRSLTRLLKEELITGRYQALFDAELERTLIDLLRLSGEYSVLLQRARAKQQLLSDRGLTNPGLEAANIGEAELWAWFAEEREDIVDDFQPKALARKLGYRDVAEFRREVLREWLFRKYG
jgi:hypothetical protein